MNESAVSTPDQQTIGYLSVIHVDGLGYCGGYLLLDPNGRPLEFHCTLPVQPDRAQQILFGKSLNGFLIGEHIARPLVQKTGLRPAIVFVDEAELGAIDRWIDATVVHLPPPESPAEEPDQAEASRDPMSEPPTRPQSPPSVTGLVEPGSAHEALIERIRQHLDLPEPFERIGEAIREAHSVRAA